MKFLSTGYGDGDGDGYGDGYGDGDGDGSGSGYGFGYGYGYGSNIKKINGMVVFLIDGVQTIILSVKKNVAKGYILNADLTLSECYIAKEGGHFAHGETLRGAVNAARDKIFADLPAEERISAFLSEFQRDKKYPATDFYNWHHKLTGSCEMGRTSFVKNKGIDLSRDFFTVNEFISLCEKEYGGSIIMSLKEHFN